jgi:putative transposase
MRTHFHLILAPEGPGTISRFMHRLTMRHAQVWHRQRGTSGTGPVYQGRFKAVPIESDESFLNACRYVERNPRAAGLVERAEQWRWGSLWRRCHRCEEPLLTPWPLPMPKDWITIVNSDR